MSLNNNCLTQNNLAQISNKSWLVLSGAWPHIPLQYGLHEDVGALQGVAMMPLKTVDYIGVTPLCLLYRDPNGL